MKKNYHSISKQNYEFGFNRDLPDDHAIVNNMPDFENILSQAKQVKQRSVFKKYTIGIGIGSGIAAAVAIMWLTGIFKHGRDVVMADNQIKKEDTTRIAFEAFTPSEQLNYINVNASEDFQINLSSSATLRIPRGTLVDSNGNAIAGNCTVAYKLLQSTSDIIKGKVPLIVTDESGDMALNPKLMFEVYSSGVKIAQGKSIEIVAQNIPQCNLYMCKRSNATWKVEQVLENNANNNIDTENKIAQAKLEQVDDINQNTRVNYGISQPAPEQKTIPQPLKPRLRNPSKPGFEIIVDKNQYPELARYENVVFEVKESNEELGFEDMIWESINVEKTAKAGEYKVILKDGRRTASCIAYPVFTRTSDFRKAQKEYDQWQKSNVEIPKLEIDISKGNNHSDNIEQHLVADTAPMVKHKSPKQNRETKIRITKFGLYAIARPQRNLPGISIIRQLKFETEDGNKTPSVIYQKSNNGSEILQTSYDNLNSRGWLNLKDVDAEIVTLDQSTGEEYITTTPEINKALQSKDKVVKMRKRNSVLK